MRRKCGRGQNFALVVTKTQFLICLSVLCTADLEHRAISRGFSGRDLGKLFNISVTRGEQSSDDSATLGSELIAMSAGEFAQKSMSSQ